MVQSGSFRVMDGSVVRPGLRETRGGTAASGDLKAKAPAAAEGRGILKDQVTADDLIVQGSACVGAAVDVGDYRDAGRCQRLADCVGRTKGSAGVADIEM